MRPEQMSGVRRRLKNAQIHLKHSRWDMTGTQVYSIYKTTGRLKQTQVELIET